MRRYVSQILVFVLIFMLGGQPVFAQYGTGVSSTNRFEEEDAPGVSFRRSDAAEAEGEAGEEETLNGMRRIGTRLTPMYQVHVLGQVNRPGTYRVTASERVSEILKRAGGVRPNGSERSIEIKRHGRVVERVDLYSFLLSGNLKSNPYVLDNDVIFVPVRKKTVEVLGAIKRPKEGGFELKGEKSLKDALKLAGGYSVGASQSAPIRVIRFENGEKRVIEVPPDSASIANFVLQDGDVIFVPHVITERNRFDYDIPKLAGDNIFYPSFEDRVFVLGGVTVPGAYPFNPYYSVDQYLTLAGGTTKMAKRTMHLITPDGKKTKLKLSKTNGLVVNPGDTIVVGERRLTPEAWMGLFMSIASFGLSTTATVLALTR